MKGSLGRFGWLALLLVGSIAAFAFWTGVRSLDEPLRIREPVRYTVAPGASFARVAADLGARGIVAWPRTWVLFARWHGFASAIKAGEYAVLPGMTPRGLLSKMLKGDVVLHSFTIVDGWRVEDLLSALRRSPEIVTTLPQRPPDLMANFDAGGTPAEGQFLPETYRFPAGTTDVDLLRQAHAALRRELESDWKAHDANLPLRSPYELLIVASIVEKETAVPEELRKVAGLYLHRLTIGMRLQADPTIIYGLGDRYDGDLHTADLRTDGPFNTYTRVGLPPTPIALAGAAAIRATALPEVTDALYFVAGPNGDGSHVFSATLAEQNAAVARYVNRRRLKEAGSPP